MGRFWVRRAFDFVADFLESELLPPFPRLRFLRGIDDGELDELRDRMLALL